MSRTASQAMLNQHGLLFDPQDQEIISTTTQMGFFSFPPNMSILPPHIPQSVKTLITTIPPPSNIRNIPTDDHDQILFSSSATSRQRSTEDHIISLLGGGTQLSLQRSSANLWPWGEVNECISSINKRSSTTTTTSGGDDHQHLGLGVSAMKMKKINIKARRKVREPRFCFKTMSDVDVLDDGYKWRKYGQKVVKNTEHPRSYYRCTQDSCRVKKRVERLAEDPRMVITTYEGRHVHSPSRDEDESQSPQLDNFFW